MTDTAGVLDREEQSDQRKPARLPGLDGIRALAILAVLAYHVYPPALPGGYLGVDLFFVLSGYLITRQLVAEKARTGRIRLGAFWARRARRILPALVPVLIVTTLGTAAVDPAGLRALRGELLGAVSFTSNWAQIAAHHSYFTRFSAPSVLQHLWSLAVEEQFYLLWPLVVVLVLWRAPRHLAVLAGVVSALSAVLMAVLASPGGDPSRSYFGTDSHCFGLLLGAALAVRWGGEALPSRFVRNLLSLTGLGVVAAGLIVLAEYRTLTYRGGIAVVCVASALLIVGAGHGRGPVGTVLSTRPARWLGARSYGLYLWHWPVLLLGDRIAGHRTPLAGTIEVALAVTFAAASYRFLERPILHTGRRPTLTALRADHRYAAKLVAAVGAVLVFAGVAVVSLTHAPPPPDAGLQAQLAIGRQAAESQPTAVPSVAPLPTRSGAARPTAGPGSSRNPMVPPGDRITALGDSVMLASAPALAKALPGIDIDAVVSRAMQPAYGLLGAKARGGRLRPIVVIGLGTNGPFPRGLLERIVRELGPYRQIYLVDVFLPTRPWEHTVNHVLDAVSAAHPNTHLVDWQDAIRPHQNLLWPDRIHPRPGAGTRLYARTLLRALAEPLGKDQDDVPLPFGVRRR